MTSEDLILNHALVHDDAKLIVSIDPNLSTLLFRVITITMMMILKVELELIDSHTTCRQLFRCANLNMHKLHD